MADPDHLCLFADFVLGLQLPIVLANFGMICK